MSESNAQAVLELSTGFVIDQIQAGRLLLGFVDALLLLAISQANVDAIRRDPVQQATYATYDRPPPDELRRPISIHALAVSLRLPFETVRRRVTRMAHLGLCRTTSSGVIVPGGGGLAPGHRAVLEGAYHRIGRLHERLQAFPDFQDIAAPGAGWPGPPPLRAAARTSAEYLLRLVDALTGLVGDPVDAAIWLEIFRSRDGDGRPRAIRPARIARQLGLAGETARRRALHLASIGACEFAPDGLIIPQAILDQPGFAAFADKNLQHLRRMYLALARLDPLDVQTAASAANQAVA